MFKYHTKKMETYYGQVIGMYLAGCSIRTILKKTGISDETIRRWIRIFADANSITSLPMKQSTKTVERPRPAETESEDVEQLKAEIKRLKRQLEDERLRARLYAKMIEITEKDLNISITKKTGVKR